MVYVLKEGVMETFNTLWVVIGPLCLGLVTGFCIWTIMDIFKKEGE